MLHHNQVAMQGWFNFWKLISVTQQMKRIKDKDNKIIPVGAEIAFVKVWHLLSLKKTLRKLGIKKKNFLNLIKTIYKIWQLTSYYNVKDPVISTKDQEKGKDIGFYYFYLTLCRSA